jgi:predicted RNA-binding Zn-ribbon protein involved in translation (DUF1610 family)
VTVVALDTHRREKTCPRCGGQTIMRRDGVFQWRACRKSKACGWTVFTHGDDARDKQVTA